MTKKCSTCQAVKPLDEFNNSKNQPMGKHNQCRFCQNSWKPNPEQIARARKRTREWNRLKATGFTPKEFQEKLNSQGNVCAICGTDDPGKLDFCADHCHDTGQKRGVICRKCNAGLGHFKDSVENLNAAIEYLEYYKAQLEKEKSDAGS